MCESGQPGNFTGFFLEYIFPAKLPCTACRSNRNTTNPLPSPLLPQCCSFAKGSEKLWYNMFIITITLPRYFSILFSCRTLLIASWTLGLDSQTLFSVSPLHMLAQKVSSVSSWDTQSQWWHSWKRPPNNAPISFLAALLSPRLYTQYTPQNVVTNCNQTYLVHWWPNVILWITQNHNHSLWHN